MSGVVFDEGGGVMSAVGLDRSGAMVGDVLLLLISTFVGDDDHKRNEKHYIASPGISSKGLPDALIFSLIIGGESLRECLEEPEHRIANREDRDGDHHLGQKGV
jgi:hypothetical protein